MARQIVVDSCFNKLFREPCGGWIAGDATYSIALPDGRSIFLMGDSFIGEVINNNIDSGAKMIRNCALIWENDSFYSLYGGSYENPENLIATDFPDSTWYWPEHGLVEDSILIIFLAKYTTDPNGTPGWNFVYLGHDIAYYSLPEISLLQITPLSVYDSNRVIYGSSVIRDSSFTYVYGRKDDTSSGFTIPYPHLARITDSINGSWDYFNGEGWTDDPLLTERINTFQVSQQYSVFKHKEKYVLITQDIWLSPKIYSFTSETPYGPWENKTLLYSTPILFDDTFTYNAFAHPQFDEDNSLLISYNTNGNFGDIFTNVEIYRPVFIRVPYELIDPDFIREDPSSVMLHNSGGFSLYPNPANDQISLDIDLDQNTWAILKIYNLNGKLEKEILFDELSINNNTITIDISDLPDGVYPFILDINDSIFTDRLIKIR